MTDLDLMIAFAKAFEERYRDRKKRNHCLSIEWKYQNGSPQHSKIQNHQFAEDAFYTALTAWGRLAPHDKAPIKTAFGIGAKSQTDYENKLEQNIHAFGEKKFNELVDNCLLKWLDQIKIECETQADFELIFLT